MIGYLMLALFLLSGLVLADGIFRKKDILVRLWLGLCAGLLLMMWTPALYAFAFGFTRTAQLAGLGTSYVFALAAQRLARSQKRTARFTDMPWWLPVAIVLPLTILSGYLQYTHILREVNGAMHVGQSTYGDLCLHLGIATSLRNAPFPPDYSLLPGTLLGYPFLADSMVTTMLLFGADLTVSFVVTGTLMMCLVFTGFVIFCYSLTRSAPATLVASALLFLNGGLGFIYAMDDMGRDATAFQEIFTGFYKTPTNQPDLNLRWVNVICDMMVPQRTLLCGWMALMPALYMLVCAMEAPTWGAFATLGVWAGAMPMVHTHSFLALGLLSAGAMVFSTLRAQKGDRLKTLGRFVLYGAIAVVLALPQLLTWTVPQTLEGGSMRVLFNWVNNGQNGKLIDDYIWFWVKNVGIIYLLMIPAALFSDDDPDHPSRDRLRHALGLGALCIYLVAEFIVFQPNIYDNNKLFYVAFIVMTPLVGLYLVRIFERLKGLRGRYLIALVFMAVSLLSGLLTMTREVVSDYRLFSSDEVLAAQYVEENAPRDAVFLTGDQHNNVIAALTGRDIVCGTGSYLYFHGLDYGRQAMDEQLMYESPAEHTDLFEQYGVSYVYISSYERRTFCPDEAWFVDNAHVVFASGDVVIYALDGVYADE